MRLIKTIVRDHKLEDVRKALDDLSVTGMTVSHVVGSGRNKAQTLIYRGLEYVPLLPRRQVEVVVAENQVDETVAAIIEAARTGTVGDGMVFVSVVSDSYRIRTGDWEG
jgi:nitrogen regulatory protein PII